MQTVNAIVDTMSATIMKQYNPGLTDPQLRQLVAAHIDDDSFCRYVIQQDINSIALDLREAHRDDFFSVPEDTPLKGLLQAADEVAREDSDPEQASLAFICKRLRLNYKKLSEEEKKWLKRFRRSPTYRKIRTHSEEKGVVHGECRCILKRPLAVCGDCGRWAGRCWEQFLTGGGPQSGWRKTKRPRTLYL